MAEKPKHLETVLRRQARERFSTYDFKKVFGIFKNQKRPISAVELAMILGVSTNIARDAIARLNTKQLIVKNWQNDWRVNSEPRILDLLRDNPEGIRCLKIAKHLDLTVDLVRYELTLMRQKKLILPGAKWRINIT